MSFGPKVLASVVTVLSLPTFRLLILAVEALNLHARARAIRSPKLITNIDLGVLISPSHFYKCIFGHLNPKFPACVTPKNSWIGFPQDALKNKCGHLQIY